jgi:hypothetical protein
MKYAPFGELTSILISSSPGWREELMVCELLIYFSFVDERPPSVNLAKSSNPLNRYNDPHLRVPNQNLPDIKELHTIGPRMWQRWKLR